MKIQIKELGAVKEATIDLSKKLTVFCGPNSTGKTYMAFVLYALTNGYEDLIFLLGDELIKQLITTNIAETPLDIQGIWSFRNSNIKYRQKFLWNLFAIPESKVEDFFGKTSIECLETKEEFQERLENISLDETVKIYDYTFHLLKKSKSNLLQIKIDEQTLKNDIFYKFLEVILPSRLYSMFAYYPITSAIIFPVERNSIYTFSTELSIQRHEAFEKIQAITNKKDGNFFDAFFRRKTRYPQPIRDALTIAEDLENIQKRNSPYYSFATDIENELLQGKVTISNEGNVEFSSDKAPKTRLSFHQSSSIVKTLASLIVYLKHRARKNDLIIIDEPELNLHPDNQVKLARIFARLINNGLRLVVSTHSDYIIREFNNLIMVASDDADVKEIAAKYNYQKDEYIQQSEIGAYLFNYKTKTAKQVVVKPIKIDKNGFEVATLDKTIEELNKISDELFYTIKYGKATT